MAVHELPVFRDVPYVVFFQVLGWLAYTLVLVLLVAAFSSSILLFLVLTLRLLCQKCSRNTTQRQRRQGCYSRWFRTVFLTVGRLLCVNVFPALFKIHETRSGRSSQMIREFMVFLDREVENDLALIAAFCSVIYNIFATSTIVFFQYFPVEVSEECLERDDKGRSLFCYLDYENVSIYSSSPVDCAEYNPNQLQELSFVCYAIAIPGLGIAVAAAFGLAKVATVSIILFVKLSESVFEMTEKQSHKLQNWRYCCKTFANAIYITVSLAVLTVVTAMVCLFSFVTLDNTSMHYNIPSVFTLSKTFNDSYICLAVLVFFPTAFIIIKLPFHCKQREYTSLANESGAVELGERRPLLR